MPLVSTSTGLAEDSLWSRIIDRRTFCIGGASGVTRERPPEPPWAKPSTHSLNEYDIPGPCLGTVRADTDNPCPLNRNQRENILTRPTRQLHRNVPQSVLWYSEQIGQSTLFHDRAQVQHCLD